MRYAPLRRRVSRVITWALLLAAATCTDGIAPDKPWITPTGQVTTDPPALLVGAGDIAGCNQTNDEATALLLDAIPGTVFTIGDNAYENGTSAQYTNCYQPTWGRHKARTKPAPGNHEYNTANASGYFNYFGAAAGEVGKGYYSYNLGAWHIIVLNSSSGTAGTNVSMAKGSTQEKWLLADLAANQNLCTLAIWHHPLYQSTAGSGTGGLTDTKSRAVWDDLYAAGAEVVLNGHRHFYERMAPQKPNRAADPAFGIREFVVGTGGMSLVASSNVSPNSEVRNSGTYGVLKLWLYADSYAWRFVPVAGKTFSDSGSTACHAAPGSGPAVSPSQSTVAAAPTSLTAGSGSSTITVTVRDASGNPISGAAVVLAAGGTGNTLTQPSGTTNASGVATGTLSSTVAQAKTVSATANGVAITQTASVTVNPGPVSAAQSTVGATPTSIDVETGISTIAVTAKDATGNPISDATVVLAASGTGNTLTQPSGTTDASGIATGTLSSTVAEAKTVSATINGTAVTQGATVTVTLGSPSAALSTVAASPSSLTAGSESATITVTVRDASGNPFSGAAVVLAASGTGNTLTQPSGTTDASGVATGTLSSTVAQAKTVSATANGVAITQTASVTVNPGPVSAALSTVGATPTTIIVGTGASAITVTAKDATGNPISGATVVLAATGSGNTLTQPAGPTNASGVATAILSSTVAELKTVSATIDGTAVTETAPVTVVAALASAVLVGAGDVASCGTTKDEATALLLDQIAGTVFTVGDNAYADGTSTEFTTCYGPTWGRHRDRTRPASGDRDYRTAGAAGYFGYFGAAAGDVDKGYYSYELGEWHIVVLNSGLAMSVGSPQEVWLRNDLATNPRQCTLAYWHLPRFYSASTSGPRASVKPLWDALFAAGADIVVNADLRVYERFAPQTPDGTADPDHGIRQFIVGTGGGASLNPFGTIMPNSQLRNNTSFGVLKLTLDAGSYAWEFVSIPGATFTDSGSGICH